MEQILKIAKSWSELPNGLQFSFPGSSKRNHFCAEWSRGRISSKSNFATFFNQVGNYVEQFDLEGNYQGEWPGWYNWPDEMVGHSKDKFSPKLKYLNLNLNHSKNILPSALNLKLERKEQFLICARKT